MAEEIKIVLAIETSATSESLRRLIESQQDMVIVGESIGPVETLMAVSKTEAQVVILELPAANTDPGICSHLLAEFPHLLILSLSANSEQGIIYRQRICKETLDNISDNQILHAIRQAKQEDEA